MRQERLSVDAIEDCDSKICSEPRHCYKYSKAQRTLYPNQADLMFQKNEAVSASPGAKNQFQLIYPVQVYPDFGAHLLDCMMNPVDIVRGTHNVNFFPRPKGL